MKSDDLSIYMALFVDNQLTKGKPNNYQTDVNWNKGMKNIIVLYSLIESKDMFLSTYTNFFRFRLIEDVSIGFEQEQAFIQLLKEEGAD